MARLALPSQWGMASFAVLVVVELAIPAIAESDARATGWHPRHIAERYELFTIIVIGESILAATGAIRRALDGGVSAELLTIAGGGLVLVFGLWWLYFERGAHEPLEGVRRGAFAWGYGHYVLFASLAAVGAGIGVAAELPGPDLKISPVSQAMAVAIPAALSLISMALLQGFLHREPAARTIRLVIGGVMIVVVAAVAEVPLGTDVALMGLVMAIVVAIDVVTSDRRIAAAGPQPA